MYLADSVRLANIAVDAQRNGTRREGEIKNHFIRKRGPVINATLCGKLRWGRETRRQLRLRCLEELHRKTRKRGEKGCGMKTREKRGIREGSPREEEEDRRQSRPNAYRASGAANCAFNGPNSN